jgi:CrcB protein
MSFLTFFWVALGSALGGMARYAITVSTVRLGDGLFPWSTLGINALGSFIIGLFFVLSLPNGSLQVGMNARVFVMTGICGGFTTFSAFSLQSVELMKDGRTGEALGYIAASVLSCLALTALGIWLGGRMGK